MNYENAIKMNNHMEEAFYNLAVCYYIQEHLHEAQLNVIKALKLNPRNEEYLKLSRELMIKLQMWAQGVILTSLYFIGLLIKTPLI